MSRRKYAPDQEALLAQLYAEGVPLAEIRRRLGGTTNAIRNAARRAGLIRPPGRPEWRRFSVDEVREMTRLWLEDGLSQSAIAARFSTSQIKVSRTLARTGITVSARPSRLRGERHGSWRGGRVVLGGGYIGVLVDPADPMASMRFTQGYVPEHRLVMARSLGRPLGSHESVHHLNGNKTDNRIENLQLRAGRHGKGIVLQCGTCGSRDIIEVALN